MRGWRGSYPRELLLRALLAAAFIQTERMIPFNRYIHPDEMWLYRNPRRDPYVSNVCLWSLVLLTPLILSLLHLIIKRDKEDFIQIMLTVSLALGMNCILTNMVKLIVGRPRPDFFWRCFPDGEMNSEMQCTGPIKDVIEGRKSFPSGHSSISFSSFGTMSWWLMGKLHVWSSCRGSSWRLLLGIIPLVVALTVALSRTCDYHHHWQDVTVGSILGLSISYMCYRQHYPSLNSQQSHKPYTTFRQSISTIHRRDSALSATSDSSVACLTCKMSYVPSENISETLIEEAILKIDKNDDAYKSIIPVTKEQVKWI